MAIRTVTSVTASAAFAIFALAAQAQEVTPPAIVIDETNDLAPVCRGGSSTIEACIALPPESVVDKVDVFFLFDDTGSFAGFVPTVTGIFSALVGDLESALPGVDFGFGVGRFEDYGGPGSDFSGEFAEGRPFILNQPIVTEAEASTAGSSLTTLINDALGRTAAGYGGDGPESAIAEGLFQVATGVGFDGDGDGSTTGSGGLQLAGAIATQTTADTSGDVPAFSTLAPGTVSSGSVGGAGFRPGALRLVILATDICSISAFDPPPATIPEVVSGTGGSEPVEAFACSSTSPGADRFGFVSDSLSGAGNTIAGAVVPRGAGTVPATVAALNSVGIRVLGMGPNAGPLPPGSSPSYDESVFLSAVARLTGAIDASGEALVFDIGSGGEPLKAAIVDAITETTTLPVDIALVPAGSLPDGLSLVTDPDVRNDVPPGGEACFNVTFTGSGYPTGSFALNFEDTASGAALGSIPGSATCEEGVSEIPVDIKPTSCRNPINTKEKGLLPVAVLGFAGFDVTQIKPDSVRLEGVAPRRIDFEDVATPWMNPETGGYTGKDDAFDCTTGGPDSFTDMTLKFDNRSVVAAMGGASRGDVLVLKLVAELNDGTSISGEDVVAIVH